MVRCPFCQYVNEDGSLFCEQCRSDLGLEEAVPEAQPVADGPGAVAPPEGESIPEAFPVDEPEEAEPFAALVATEPPVISEPLAEKMVTPAVEPPALAAAGAGAGQLPPGARPRLVVV